MSIFSSITGIESTILNLIWLFAGVAFVSYLSTMFKVSMSISEITMLSCFLFVVYVAGTMLIKWIISSREGLKITTDSNEYMDDTEVDSDVFDSAPAPEYVSLAITQPKSLPDVNPEQGGLDSFYDYDLKGDDDVEQEIVGNGVVPEDNYNNGYTLGVDLNDPEYKALGVVQNANKLVASDLLPKDKKDWFETPNVGTSIQDANLLADATFRMGIDTLGNYRKGMTIDPRGAIPVPKITVSPWNQSSRDADTTVGWCT